MTPARSTPLPPNAVGGFALVGVVMFVLVLTILGLSLFSLSTIEGQFLNRSTSSAEAFYAASEGLERSRFVLSTTRDLGSVGTWVEGGTIVNAVAMQVKGTPARVESTGSVAWNSPNPIIVRVLAVQRGQRSFLETRLEAVRNEDLYRRLLTLSNDLDIAAVNPTVPFYPTMAQTWLTGELWKNGNNPSWQAAPGYGAGLTTQRPGSDVVPTPDVGTYFAQHMAGATVVNSISGVYTLDAGVGGTAYFKSVGAGNWSLEDDNGTTPPSTPPRIRVRGKVFWLLDHGVRFDRSVTVEPAFGGVPLPGDALVIVAGKNYLTDPSTEDDAFKGIAFKSGLDTGLVPVPLILVSDGIVSIEHKVANATGDSRVKFLSIYADGVYLLGPHGAGGTATSTLRIEHTPGNPVYENLIDLLYDLGLLPNTSAGVDGTLPPVAGSWRDLTESNPS